jgi:DNA-binding XRE family transcriptional regulator
MKTTRHPAITAEKIKTLKSLARKIDAEEGASIRARGRAVFARHEGLLGIVQSLKTARQKQGLTLENVAREIGVAKSNLSRLENSTQTMPRIDTLDRYAKAVGKILQVKLATKVRRSRSAVSR